MIFAYEKHFVRSSLQAVLLWLQPSPYPTCTYLHWIATGLAARIRWRWLGIGRWRWLPNSGRHVLLLLLLRLLLHPLLLLLLLHLQLLLLLLLLLHCQLWLIAHPWDKLLLHLLQWQVGRRLYDSLTRSHLLYHSGLRLPGRNDVLHHPATTIGSELFELLHALLIDEAD